MGFAYYGPNKIKVRVFGLDEGMYVIGLFTGATIKCTVNELEFIV